MLGCNGGVLDDYYYKARIFITNRLQNYFAMINRNLNLDKKFAIVSYHMIEVKVPFSDLLIRTIHVTWNMKEFSRKTCFF